MGAGTESTRPAGHDGTGGPGQIASDHGGPSLLRAAGSISVLTLASRVLGLGRDMLSANVLGVNWVSDTFLLAWTLPNMLRRLLGEGALSASFIPVFARKLERGDQAGARRLLASVLGLLIAALGTLSIVVVAAVWLVPLDSWIPAPTDGTPSAERAALLVELLTILFPYCLPVCVLAILGGALQAFDRFAPAAAAPAVLNVFWIAALLAIPWFGEPTLPDIVRWIALVLLFGAVAQLALVAIPLARLRFMPMPARPIAGDGSSEVFRAMVPTAIGMSLVQVNLLVDQTLAYWIVEEGATNHIYYANRLLQFPFALIALPLATAVFPRLSAHASRDDLGAFTAQLGRAANYTTFLAIPATIGLALIAGDLLDVAFVHGRFTAADARTTEWATITLVIGLPAMGLAQLRARALYALGRNRDPARIAFVLVGLNLVGDLVLVFGFDAGVLGLTIATSMTAFANVWLLGRAVRRATGQGTGLRAPSDRASWLRTLLATVAMAAAVLGVRAVFTPESRLMTALALVVAPMVAGIGVFCLASLALGIPEFVMLRNRITRKLRR